MVAIGIPDTITNGLGTVGMAMPPCAQVTTAPTCKMVPASLSSASVTTSVPWLTASPAPSLHGPVTTSAVSLMLTIVPIIMIVASPGPQVR